jgi:hypothetical protein
MVWLFPFTGVFMGIPQPRRWEKCDPRVPPRHLILGLLTIETVPDVTLRSGFVDDKISGVQVPETISPHSSPIYC